MRASTTSHRVGKPHTRGVSAVQTHSSPGACIKALIGTLLALAALAGWAPPAGAQSSEPILHKSGEIRYVKGRLLVQPRAGLKTQEFDTILRGQGARRVEVIRQLNIHIVELPAQADERAVAQRLIRNPHVKFAQVDRQLVPALTPNDPFFGSGWHLPRIGTPGAWDYSNGAGVTIAVLDTGVDPAHPDLAASLVPGYNAFDDNTDTRDVFGHGTKVAGSAAMVGNNLMGGAGVAFKAGIMPIRVTDAQGFAYDSALAKGLAWAADHGARVANMSFLGVCGAPALISAAQYLRNKGGVVTGSGGNTGVQELDAPSGAITCVSATDGSDTKASWSSYGDYIDVAAPGVGVYTTTNGGGYGSVSGTSFSAPVTGAVYALMMAANPQLGPTQLDNALYSTAVDLGSAGKDLFYGYGRVDAAAAVAKARTAVAADTTAPSVAIVAPGAGVKVNGTVAVDVSASDNMGVTRVEFYAGNALIASEAISPYGFSWDTSALPDGPIALEARAFDGAGNVGSTKVSVTVANDTTPPAVTILNPQSGSVVSGSVQISASATDNVKVQKLSLLIDGKEVALAYGSTLNYTWNLAKGKGGGSGKGKGNAGSATSTITARAEDTAGNAASASVTVTRQ